MKHKHRLMWSVALTACLLQASIFAAERGAKPGTKPPAHLRKAFANPKDNPGLPNVLLIGDSISIGYTLAVRKLLVGKADVFRPLTNCAHSGSGVRKIKKWVGTRKWDVIHFNFGIWDTHLLHKGRLVRKRSKYKPEDLKRRYTTEQHVENLTKIVATLKKTGARLIWASTTPYVSYGEDTKLLVVKNNKAARAFMGKNNIAVNDLHALALPNLKTWQSSDGCHFNRTGYAQLARQVAAHISAALGKGVDMKWKLVWSDEFNYEGLPDKKKWGYEEGFVRNKEMQYYTRARKQNARVEKGMLVIEGRKEKFKNPGHKPGSKNWKQARDFASYTAASLITLNQASWKYGRVEVRAKLPQGKGVWPAIWMMGAVRASGVRWPACGEIDIMEFVGKDPHRIHANAHYPVDGKHQSSGGKLKTRQPFADFHVYAIEWNPERIDFFFDETRYYRFQIDEAGKGKDNPFRKPHYLLINLALGGSWGGPIGDAVLPQKYLIDYVRVYESKPGQPAKTPARK
jgi:beta-glucanase (GH16 family)